MGRTSTFDLRPFSAVVLALTLAGCPGSGAGPAPKAGATSTGSAPAWVTHVEVEGGKLCGVGVAGAGYDDYSPYPKQFSRERAVKNLAGVVSTSVLEAIVDRANNAGDNVELARGLTVDEDLVAKIDGMAKVEYWVDREGVGPFAQKNFTYARACVDAKVAASSLKVDAKRLTATKPRTVSPGRVPGWVTKIGKQPGGRLCAVGFSQPMFFADNTFESVIEDIRGQLAEVLETLVSQYTEDLANGRTQLVEMMTVATTNAVSKGAVVTDFWFDRDGIGPQKHERSTYGWGCVYPVEVVQESVAAVEQKLPEKTVTAVRERAARAFEDLDAEEARRGTSATRGATSRND